MSFYYVIGDSISVCIILFIYLNYHMERHGWRICATARKNTSAEDQAPHCLLREQYYLLHCNILLSYLKISDIPCAVAVAVRERWH